MKPDHRKLIPPPKPTYRDLANLKGPKLNAAEVQRMRQLYSQYHKSHGLTYADLAEQFHMGLSAVHNIIRRRSWKNIPDAPPAGMASRKKVYSSLLSVSQIQNIKYLYATTTITQRQLADAFEVSLSTIGHILKGRTQVPVETQEDVAKLIPRNRRMRLNAHVKQRIIKDYMQNPCIYQDLAEKYGFSQATICQLLKNFTPEWKIARRQRW